ncbi:MAG: hypothetical protein NZ473_00765 [Candidatus Kapabacteria bacterium]|nr:hypothetical protein [Candidatus Kapabacteria bacterium]MDW8225106.1 hypothetical protein [Bacteroidota bacterium]
MAVRVCPVCNRSVSRLAKQCPHCGAVLSAEGIAEQGTLPTTELRATNGPLAEAEGASASTEAWWKALQEVPSAYRPSGRATLGAQLGVLAIALGLGMGLGLLLHWLYFGSWEWIREFLGNPVADEPPARPRGGRAFVGEMGLFVVLVFLGGLVVGIGVRVGAVALRHRNLSRLRLTGMLGCLAMLGTYVWLTHGTVGAEVLDSLADAVRLGLGGVAAFATSIALSAHKEPFCEMCETYMEELTRQYLREAVPELLHAIQAGDFSSVTAHMALRSESVRSQAAYGELSLWYCPSCRSQGIVELKAVKRSNNEGTSLEKKRIASQALSGETVDILRRQLESSPPKG